MSSIYPLRQLTHFECSDKERYKSATLQLGKFIYHKFDGILKEENLDNLFQSIKAQWKEESLEKFSTICSYSYKWNEKIEAKESVSDYQFFSAGQIYLRDKENGPETFLNFQFLMKAEPKMVR